jgi:hypothetical protein
MEFAGRSLKHNAARLSPAPKHKWCDARLGFDALRANQFAFAGGLQENLAGKAGHNRPGGVDHFHPHEQEVGAIGGQLPPGKVSDDAQSRWLARCAAFMLPG